MNKNKLDILLMTDNSIETVGGEQESTKIILDGVKKVSNVGIIQPGYLNFHDPQICYYEISKETRLKHIIKKPYNLVKYLKKVKKIINENNPRIIHTQSQVSFLIVALLKRTHQISSSLILIHTERGLYTKYNNFFKQLFLFFMKELNVLVTTTNFNKKYWKKALERKNISLEYRVIENTAGKIYEELDEDLLNSKKDYFSIGFSGRYTDWKNWPLAVEISKQLNNYMGENLHVNMAVGCLDEKSEKDTEKMFNYMEKLLGNRFEGKINIDMEQMNLFYYDIDAFILTSKHNTESFGRTLVEAMSRMTAVLTTDAGGSVEVVGGSSKVFVSTEEFTNHIIKLYENPNVLVNEKKSNLERVKEKYSLDNNLNKHKIMYREMLSLKNGN